MVDNEMLNIPVFFTLLRVNNKKCNLKWAPTLIEEVGQYLVTFIITDDDDAGSYNGIQTNSFEFTLTVDGVNDPPDFSTSLDDSYELDVLETLTINFPSYTDPDLLDFHTETLELSGYGSLPVFMSKTSSGISFSPTKNE